jgi:hypothetical protein
VALPSFEKTWEFSLSHFVDNRISGITTDEIAGRYMSVALLNVLTDKKKKAWGGTFTDQGSGTVRFTPTTVAGWPYGPSGQELYETSDVGLDIEFVGCNSAGNDGTFTITAVDTSAGAWVEFTNSGSPVFEADTACAVAVLWGNFTVPLTLKGSSGSQAGRGAGMDGKDRWLSPSDIRSYSSGDRDWFVLQTANGCELLFWHYTTNLSYEYEMATIYFSCESGFTGGTTSTKPSATDEVLVIGTAQRWGPLVDPFAHTLQFHMMMSSDGDHARFFAYCDAYWGGGLFIGMEAAKNPVTGGSLIPWNGNNNVAWWVSCAASSQNTAYMTYEKFRDDYPLRATFDKDASAGGPYTPGLILTSEHVSDAAVGENIGNYGNELASPSCIFWPIGIAANDTNIKGRVARLPDIWFAPNGGGTCRTHATFSSTGSKTFKRIGDFILPWDGSTEIPYYSPS